MSVYRLEDYSTYTAIAIYRKALLLCCFLLMVGCVSNLQFTFISGSIHFLDVVGQLSMLKYFLENSINLVILVLIRKSIITIFREDINYEIEHLSNVLLLKISRVVYFIIQYSCNSCNLVELVSKESSSQFWKKNR